MMNESKKIHNRPGAPGAEGMNSPAFMDLFKDLLASGMSTAQAHEEHKKMLALGLGKETALGEVSIKMIKCIEDAMLRNPAPLTPTGIFQIKYLKVDSVKSELKREKIEYEATASAGDLRELLESGLHAKYVLMKTASIWVGDKWVPIDPNVAYRLLRQVRKRKIKLRMANGEVIEVASCYFGTQQEQITNKPERMVRIVCSLLTLSVVL